MDVKRQLTRRTVIRCSIVRSTNCQSDAGLRWSLTKTGRSPHLLSGGESDGKAKQAEQNGEAHEQSPQKFELRQEKAVLCREINQA